MRVESAPRPYNILLSHQFEAKLDAAAGAYVNDSRSVSYEDGPVFGSKLYDRRKVDDGYNDRELLAPSGVTLNPSVPRDLQRATGSPGTAITGR